MNKKLANVVQWILGGIFGLWAIILFLTSGALAGVLTLIFAVFLTPIRSIVIKKLNLSVKPVVLICTGVFLFFASCGTLATGTTTTAPEVVVQREQDSSTSEIETTTIESSSAVEESISEENIVVSTDEQSSESSSLEELSENVDEKNGKESNNDTNNSDVNKNPTNAAAENIEEAAPVPVDNGNGNVIVHITESGSKYHNAGCSYLKKSDIEITLDDAKSRGLAPCSKCNPPQ